MKHVAEVRKAIAALAAAAAILSAQGLLSGQVENWTTGVLAAAGAAAVFYVPNAEKVQPLPKHNPM